MRSTLFALAVVSFAGTTLAQGQCRFPNGTLLPDTPGYDEYTPCTSGPTSICCGLNRNNTAGGDPSKGFTKDECLPNGLCQNRITTNGVQTTSYWVDFCTEEDVNSSKCLNVCDQSRAGFGNTPLTPCTGRADSDRWCCGSSNACCTSNVGVVNLAQVLGASLSSSIVSSARSSATSSASASASNSASSSAASGTGAPSTTGSATPQQTGKKSGLSGGAIAGIVIGVVAGLALLAAALFFARRASKYKKAAAGSQYHEAPAGQPPQYPGYVAPGSEKYGQVQHNQGYAHNTPPTELPAMHAAELPSPEAQNSPKPLLHQQA